MKLLLVLIISQALVQCFETKSSKNDGISPVFDAMQKWRNREAKITQESFQPKQSRVSIDDLMNKRPTSLVQSMSQIKGMNELIQIAKHSQSITNTVQTQINPKPKQTLDKFIPAQEPIIKKAESQLQTQSLPKQDLQEKHVSQIQPQQSATTQQQKQNSNQQTNNLIQKNKIAQPVKSTVPSNLQNLRTGSQNNGPITGQSNGKLSFMSHLIGHR
ncbi:hypothetical protein pb186bvf_003470 [Paramecium bursaria]